MSIIITDKHKAAINQLNAREIDKLHTSLIALQDAANAVLGVRDELIDKWPTEKNRLIGFVRDFGRDKTDVFRPVSDLLNELYDDGSDGEHLGDLGHLFLLVKEREKEL